MDDRRGLFRLFALLLACFTLSCSLSSEWEKKLTIYPLGADLPRGQGSDDDEEEEGGRQKNRIESGTSQKTWKDGDALRARYSFVNFNRDKLSVSFGMNSADYRGYLEGYGYTDAETAALREWREQARQAAWKRALLKGGKAAAEKAVAEVDMDYDTKLRRLLRIRGLALRIGNIVECDMPVIVRRNVTVLKSLALAFQKLAAEGSYGPEETVGAVVSMVQTAVSYRIPPMLEGKRHTGGLLPPVKSLLSGWGDCDTKTGVAASILGNWSGMRLVGLAVPGHYLMAIRRLPAKGDMFVTYEGLEYVLIEPAGPAWLQPGTASRNTASLLEGGAGYTVEPFF